jgi:hypothetical protein
LETETVAVAVAVPLGTYRTLTVQLPPALITNPDVQLPPVIENVPPAVPTLLIVGAAVNVIGPVAAAE